MTKKVLVPIANGTEEIEAVGIIDTLRRAGAEVTVASVNDLMIKASRGVNLVADKLIEDCASEEYDLIALPGGLPGADNLRDDRILTELLKAQADSGKFYAAICASPVVILKHHGLLKTKNATAYPSLAVQLDNMKCISERVVVDENCITSQGAGSTLEFSIKLIELLFDAEKAKQIADSMLIKFTQNP